MTFEIDYGKLSAEDLKFLIGVIKKDLDSATKGYDFRLVEDVESLKRLLNSSKAQLNAALSDNLRLQRRLDRALEDKINLVKNIEELRSKLLELSWVDEMTNYFTTKKGE